jgi:recombination protein RecA
MIDSRKSAVLAAALSEIELKASARTETLTSDGRAIRSEVFSSGSLALDIDLGLGGFPAGRFVEIAGSESCGKTTICLQAIARAQANGSTCAYLDAEHALDATYAESLGVDLDALVYYRPETAEQAFEIIRILVVAKAVDIIVVDSIAALLPRAEAMGLANDSALAELLTRNLKLLTPLVAQAKTLVLCTNQIRDNFSSVDQVATPGGHAWKHYASMRLLLQPVPREANRAVPGVEIMCMGMKNKLGAQYTRTTLYFNRGLVRDFELTELGRRYGVLEKREPDGPLMFGDVVIGKSTGEARSVFQSTPGLADQLEAAIRLAAAADLNGTQRMHARA